MESQDLQEWDLVAGSLVFIPPSQPSPTGEGAGTKLFPPGGNGKGGNKQLALKNKSIN